MKIALTFTKPNKGETVAVATVSDGRPPEPKSGESVRFYVDGGSVDPLEVTDSEGRASKKLNLAPGNHAIEAILSGTLNTSGPKTVTVEGEKKDGSGKGLELAVHVTRIGNGPTKYRLQVCATKDGKPIVGAKVEAIGNDGKTENTDRTGGTDSNGAAVIQWEVSAGDVWLNFTVNGTPVTTIENLFA